VTFDAAFKVGEWKPLDMLPKNRQTTEMKKLPTDSKQRQDMIRIARAGVESGLKRKRIAENLGISDRDLYRLLNNR